MAVGLSACVPSVPGPVDDETLYAQIADLDGVVSVDLSFESDITYGSRYRGSVVIDPALSDDDFSCATAHVSEILWQGRRTSRSSVLILRGEEEVGALGGGDLTDVYGPRPSEPRESATISPCSETGPG